MRQPAPASRMPLKRLSRIIWLGLGSGLKCLSRIICPRRHRRLGREEGGGACESLCSILASGSFMSLAMWEVSTLE